MIDEPNFYIPIFAPRFLPSSPHHSRPIRFAPRHPRHRRVARRFPNFTNGNGNYRKMCHTVYEIFIYNLSRYIFANNNMWMFRRRRRRHCRFKFKPHCTFPSPRPFHLSSISSMFLLLPSSVPLFQRVWRPI